MSLEEFTKGLKQDENGVWQGSISHDLSYPESGNEDSLKLEESSFWFKHRNQCISTLIQNFPPTSNGPIFDIGGGNGYVSMRLQSDGLKTVLVEPGQVGALAAKNRGLEHVICAEAGEKNFKADRLPAVGLLDVIEHIKNDKGFLNMIRSLLAKKGMLYATVPAYNWLWSEEDVYAGHFRRYTKNTICSLFEKAGFNIEFYTYIFTFLPLPIYFIRALSWKLGINRADKLVTDAAQHHTAPGGLKQKILNGLLKFEINSIRNKSPLWMGGSCLVAARRT